MRNDTFRGREAVLTALRDGPLPTTRAATVAKDRHSLKVIISRLRSEGYVIELERDPNRLTGDGEVNRKAGQYVLKSEPTVSQ